MNPSGQQPLKGWGDIETLSITPVEGRGSLRAFVNIRIGDLIIHDCRIIQELGKKPWFSLPVLSYKNQYGTTQYRTLVQILDENLKNEISQVVLSTWEKTIGDCNGKNTK